MIITKDKVASLTYSLTLNDFDGQIIETIGKDQAVDFLFGNGKLLIRDLEKMVCVDIQSE